MTGSLNHVLEVDQRAAKHWLWNRNMHTIIAWIDWTICKVCDPCSARYSCKVRAIVKFDHDEPAIIDETRCNGCGVCVPACDFEAIALVSPNGSSQGYR